VALNTKISPDLAHHPISPLSPVGHRDVFITAIEEEPLFSQKALPYSLSSVILLKSFVPISILCVICGQE
jgi:hypothetical protein